MPQKQTIQRLETKRLATALAALVFCIVSHAAFFIAYLAFSGSPDVIQFLFSEDHLVEWVGALVFLVAGVFAIRALFVQPPEVLRDRIALVLIALIGVVGFLDEISFGDRIFELDLPVLGGMRVDGFHDLLSLGDWIRWEVIGPVPEHLKIPIVLTALAIATAVIWAIYRARHALFDRKSAALSIGMGCLVALVLLKAVIASVIDIKADEVGAHYHVLQSIEEVAELNIAVLVLFACLMIQRTTAKFASRPAPVRSGQVASRPA